MRRVKISRSLIRSKLSGDESVISRLKELMTEPIIRYNRSLRLRQQVGTVEFLDQEDRFLTGLTDYIRQLVSTDTELTDVEIEYEDPKPVPSLSHHLGSLSERLQRLPNFESRPYVRPALEAFLREGRGIWKCATNTGKTYLLGALVAVTGLRVLVIVPPLRTELLKQGAADFSRLGVADISIVRASRLKISQVVFASAATLVQRLHTDRTAYRKWTKEFDVLAFDECHEIGGQVRELIENTLCKYRLFMSATPFKQGDTIPNLYLLGYAGKVLYEVTNKDLVDGGYSARPYVLLLRSQSSHAETQAEEFITHGDYSVFYQRAVVEDDQRNTLIVATVKTLFQLGLTTVVFIERKEHARRLKDMTDEIGISSEIYTGEVSDDDRSDRFTRLGQDLHVIYANRILTTGRSTQHITAIVEATGTKKQHTRLQMIGRGLRKKSDGQNKIILVDIQDTTPVLRKSAGVRQRVWRNDKAIKVTAITFGELRQRVKEILGDKHGTAG